MQIPLKSGMILAFFICLICRKKSEKTQEKRCLFVAICVISGKMRTKKDKERVKKMELIFKKLELENFKSHENLSIEFSDVTKIEGDNGKGKTSIAEAIAWLLFGTDYVGSSKFDPVPLTADADTITSAALTAEIDGKEQCFKKLIKKGKNTFYISDVPKKAKEFDAEVANYFTKDLFLSLYNPTYFPTQHWKDQRAQLLQYVEEPLDAEVLDKLPKLQKEALADLLKKHKLPDIKKIYDEKYKQKDNEYTRMSERVKLLNEQIEESGTNVSEEDKKTLTGEAEALKEQIASVEKANQVVNAYHREKAQLEFRRVQLKNQLKRKRAEYKQLEIEEIKGTCKECGQPLTDEALAEAKKNHQKRVEEVKKQGSKIIEEGKAVTEELKNLQAPNHEKVHIVESQALLHEVEMKLERIKRVEQAKKTAEQTKQLLENVRTERNEAITVLEAIKEFETQKSELMAVKVNVLFNVLSVKIFEHHKNGNISTTFEIEYDKRPYSKLSTAERIKAGLELITALIGLTDLKVPVFIDNAESITKFSAPPTQIITSTVKRGNLKVKGDE